MKKFMKFIGLLVLLLILPILGLTVTYLVDPNYVQEKAYTYFYPTVRITDAYANQITVEVPPVYELLYVASALTPTFQQDANLLSSNTNYYRTVEKEFGHLRKHPLVQQLDAKLTGRVYSLYFQAVQVLALNYQLTSQNTLTENEGIRLNLLLKKLFAKEAFIVPEEIELIEDFAQQAKFYQFYQTHQAYYHLLENQYRTQCNFGGMQQWLENKFSTRHSSYRIVFSPLTGGNHSTQKFTDPERQATQTLMFVNAPAPLPDSATEIEQQIARSKTARIVFTEIDHNYVNPLTDRYLQQLTRAMPDYTFWNEEKQGYSSAYGTFNEYMTWGIFSLYATDTYNPENLEEILSIQEDFMSNHRGFTHFKAFNRELLNQYALQNKPDIDQLYPKMLAWMQTYPTQLDSTSVVSALAH